MTDDHMIRYALGYLSEYSDHPLLIALFVIGVALFVASIVVEVVRGGEAAGWLGVYAIMAVSMALVGYGLVLTGKLVVNYQKQRGVS